MANEIQITSKLNVSKGGASATNLTSTDTVDMTGDNISSLVQDVGTTYEQVSTGDVATSAAYWLQIYNMDATNFMYVSYDAGTTNHDIIPPGGLWGPVKKNASKVVHVKFDTAAGLANVTSCEA